jgi:hypothetical protein
MKSPIYQKWLDYMHKRKANDLPYVGFLTYKNHFSKLPC